MTLGQRIRQARIDRGMTQKQLVGDQFTRNMLSKIENDSATPSVRTLEYLATRLSLPAGYFLAGAKYSDGTSPDGLDEMRLAYREGRYADCIDLLEQQKYAATSDEGYLLHSRASLAAAREAMQKRDYTAAKEYADSADYYNRQTMYYSAETDAEMSLILAECALVLAPEEFEENAKEYTRAASSLCFATRFLFDRVEYLLLTGEPELALRLLSTAEDGSARYEYLRGWALLSSGDFPAAAEALRRAEEANDPALLDAIYRKAEECYKAMEDYKMAYTYAARQRG